MSVTVVSDVLLNSMCFSKLLYSLAIIIILIFAFAQKNESFGEFPHMQLVLELEDSFVLWVVTENVQLFKGSIDNG